MGTLEISKAELKEMMREVIVSVFTERKDLPFPRTLYPVFTESYALCVRN